jgi:hypothetical protein
MSLERFAADLVNIREEKKKSDEALMKNREKEYEKLVFEYIENNKEKIFDSFKKNNKYKSIIWSGPLLDKHYTTCYVNIKWDKFNIFITPDYIFGIVKYLDIIIN